MLEIESFGQETREYEEDAEETLSLCDLPLYSDPSSEWEEDSSPKNDYFEFSSQELISPCTKSASLPENIIFCGKIIPYKQPDRILKSTKEPIVESKKKRSLFTWNFNSKRSSKVHVSNSMNGTTKSSRDELKMSALTPSLSGKAGWYLCLFGISSFSQEAVLKDQKSRQKSRKQPLSPMFGFPSMVESNGRGRGGDRGKWGLMRALSCGANNPATTNVTAYLKY